jgi:hypothetical protein
MFCVAPLSAADVVISDKVLAPEFIEMLHVHDIKVLLA